MKPSHKEPIINFAPEHVSSRHDGWTAERQIAFIEALAETACVEEACRRVGMSDSSAYRLRRSPRGAPFRQAWDAALDYALHRLEQAALSRALNGVPRPIFYKGEQVGEWREYDERLTLFLLHNRRRARFGKWTRQLPDDPPSQVEEDVELDGRLDRIEFMDTFVSHVEGGNASRVEE
ncbi:hypothetical protein LZ016_06585 [Sphingomonas sp. SM33]|uniref:Transposase n=1 Tax=Sphingomonas telluris TaxID=2907998 RepID=A0ABS9VLC2_9SPHN|nr:hypothetical protein [Sphingomonas telluris]MCH8615766.1 hypothetical protein [Sphingomonas telluris]